MMDKRIVCLYVVTIFLIIIGISYGMFTSSYELNTKTALINIDEDAYGSNSIDTSNLDFKPILDNEVENTNNQDNIIKIKIIILIKISFMI